MKNRKRILKQFHYWECDTFAQYLHNMSAKGWHFIGWKLGLVFEKGEPRAVDYDVEAFPKGSEMDTRPEPDTEEYADYCEAAGWKFIDSRRKFCVFKKKRRDAIPIVTPEERLYNIKKAGFGQWLWETSGIVFIAASLWFEFLTQNFEQWIFFDLMLLVLVAALLGCMEKAIEVFAMLLTGQLKKRQLKEGKVPFYGGKGQAVVRYLRNYLWMFEIGAYLLLSYIKGFDDIVLIILVVIGFMLLFMAVLEILRPSRVNNWAVQVIAGFGITIVLVPVTVIILMSSDGKATGISEAEIPLTQADYKNVSGHIIQTDEGNMNGILGSLSYFEVEYGEEGQKENVDTLWYYVYQTNHSWILDHVWERYLEDAYRPQDCTADWKALAAFESGELGHLYRVRFQDKLLYMYSDDSLDTEQIQVVKRRLDL